MKTLNSLLSLSCLLLVVIASPLAAQQYATFETEDGLRGTVTALLSPNVDRTWASLQLEVYNEGETLRSLEVRIESGRSFNFGSSSALTWEFDLGVGAPKTQILPVHLGEGSSQMFRVTVLEAGRRINPQDLRVVFQTRGIAQFAQGNDFPYLDLNLMLVTTELTERDADRVRSRFKAALALNDEITVKTPPQSIDVRHLPVAIEAYEAVDWFVLIGVEPADLSIQQRAALQSAVRAGRLAWIVPGPSGEGNGWVLDPKTVVKRSLLLKSIDNTQEISYGGRTTTVQLEELPEDPLDSFQSDDDPGTVRMVGQQADGTEVALVRTYPEGLGSWRRIVARRGDYLPIDPRIEWNSIGRVTAGAFHDLELGNSRRRTGGGSSRGAAMGWVQAIDDRYRTGVSIVLVFALIVTYLFGVGPLLFWLLKRKGRLIWLLWIQPIVVAGFLIGTYITGYAHFGVVSESHHTLVVQQPRVSIRNQPLSEAEGWGYGYSLLTRYNPREQTMAFQCRDQSLPIFRSRSQIQPNLQWRFDSEARRLEKVELATWSYSQLLSSGAIPLGGALRIQVDHVPRSEASDQEANSSFQLQVTVQNDLPFPVSNLAIWSTAMTEGPSLSPVKGKQIQVFSGDLLPGQQRVLTSGSRSLRTGFIPIDELTAAELYPSLNDALVKQFFQHQKNLAVVAEFDPSLLPGGVPFGLETEYQDQSGYLLVLETE